MGSNTPDQPEPAGAGNVSGNVRGNHSKLVQQCLEAVRCERRLKKKDRQVQPNQEVGHERRDEAGLIVAKGNHEGSNNLIVCN